MRHSGITRFALLCLVLAGPATLGGSGCAGSRTNLVAVKTPITEAGLVFVVDGAGNYHGCSKHLRKLVAQDHLPLQLVTVDWSHGFGRSLADQIGYAHARAQGFKLAQAVYQVRVEHPGVPLHLVGHSAGAAVVIAALETLPPCTVDRAVLLAPSMSATYDIRPALAGVRHGLHVYYSRRDIIYLGVWTGILGNSDRRWGPSSGRIGFQVHAGSPEDAALYSRLFQRAWQPADRAVGNDGKHYGAYQPDFVRAHIVPLLL
jgi:pimeloyl-ACP methyl ester carboxylesterase